MVDDDLALKNIAANIRRLLEVRKPPENQQKWLAEKTGETEMRISYYVNAQRMPGSGVLARIAEALAVTMDDLVAPPPKSSRKKSA